MLESGELNAEQTKRITGLITPSYEVCKCRHNRVEVQTMNFWFAEAYCFDCAINVYNELMTDLRQMKAELKLQAAEGSIQ
jgi:hypothetical protein